MLHESPTDCASLVPERVFHQQARLVSEHGQVAGWHFEHLRTPEYWSIVEETKLLGNPTGSVVEDETSLRHGTIFNGIDKITSLSTITLNKAWNYFPQDITKKEEEQKDITNIKIILK